MTNIRTLYQGTKKGREKKKLESKSSLGELERNPSPSTVIKMKKKIGVNRIKLYGTTTVYRFDDES
ncbi:hypothetical protein KSF78_0004239 [Schistosoma japonicum]|nr:hypothetical protein KSF78_0004239 [Schistosoma japonicum]